MKKLLSILLIATLLSCQNNTKPVIREKSYTSAVNKLPNCICMYGYSGGGSLEWTTFQDSCNKYNVFDTLVGVNKNK